MFSAQDNMTSSAENTDFIIYYIIAVIAIICNLVVLIFLLRKYKAMDLMTGRNPFLTALFVLHFSNVFECFTLLPYIFQFNHNFCIFMESIKVYFGLMNLFTILVLVIAHRVTLLHNVQKFTLRTRYYAHSLMFLLPLISFLPFADNAYEYPNDPWCALPASANIGWAICVQYIWVWIIAIFALLSNIDIMYRVCILDKNYVLFRRFVSNCGAFSFISGVSWIPRSYAFFNDDDSIDRRFIQYFPMNVAAILFCILFAVNLNTIIRYQSETSKEFGGEVTWDAGDMLRVFDSLKFDLRPSSIVQKKSIAISQITPSFSFPINPMISSSDRHPSREIRSSATNSNGSHEIPPFDISGSAANSKADKPISF